MSLKFKSLTQRQVTHLIKNTAARINTNNKDTKPSNQVTSTRSHRQKKALESYENYRDLWASHDKRRDHILRHKDPSKEVIISTAPVTKPTIRALQKRSAKIRCSITADDDAMRRRIEVAQVANLM